MDASFDLEMAAASLRADGGDIHVLVKVLVDQLSDALGPRLQVERGGGRFRKGDQIKSIRVLMGDDEFDAVIDGPALRCSVGHQSGGIRIRNESLSVDAWIARLLGALQGEAAHSQSARAALENLVIGGST